MAAYEATYKTMGFSALTEPKDPSLGQSPKQQGQRKTRAEEVTIGPYLFVIVLASYYPYRFDP